MKYAIVADGIVKCVDVDNDIFKTAIEVPDDIQCGDLYNGEKFEKITRPEIQYEKVTTPLTGDQLADILLYLGYDLTPFF